ncbi:unnamed protein product [Fraxinus pennsylvanica]|uniref:Uncharacterized protein n=1 Tax=Fraxinus pennsylvanica TaxID=56036 RepID=A0AAD1YYB7_9LAMI|nr:unnamed protein product [Fraxinus pennsylvanica]
MVVRLQLSRFGCRNKPFYRVMAADSTIPSLRSLAFYGFITIPIMLIAIWGQDDGKRMGLNFDRVKMSVVSYLSSHLAHAKFVSASLVAATLESIANWCYGYCKKHDVGVNPRAHKVFY